jgi:hypothetical protein
MARIERRKNTGCLVQGVGVLSLVIAVATFWTVIGMIGFGLVGVWLILYGGMRLKWYACSECGTRLAHKKVKICPHCRSVFL